MSINTLAISVVGSCLTSLLYLYIGQVLRHRKVSPEAQLAQSMFVMWWQTLGSLGLLGASMVVLYMTDNLPIWLYQTYLTVVLLALFVALWGLQFYLVYLYTGSTKSFRALGIFYALLFTATMALVNSFGTPERIADNGWGIKTEPPLHFGPAFNIALTLLLIGPQVAAALAYARLYRKATDPTQKYRIAMVTAAILVWFGSSLLAAAAQVGTSLWWQLTSRVISVGGALVILMAYKPPAWVRRRGIRSIRDEQPPTAPSQPAA